MDEMETGSGPRVVRKVYKVGYASPRNNKSSTSSDQKRMSMKTYNKETDGDIFKLGSAFKSGDFNLDDFLNSFTNAPGCTVEKGEDGKTTITRVSRIGALDEEDESEGLLAASDGNRTQTFITKKPIVTQKRTITVMRNGVPVEADDDLLRKLNLDHLIEEGNEEGRDGEGGDAGDERRETEHEEEVEVGDKNEEVEEADDVVKDPGRPTFIDLDSDEVSLFSSSEDETPEKSWVTSCFQRSPKKRKSNNGVKGGRVGMAASEVSSPGQESKLPAIQMLVLNYNRMLAVDPGKFKETFFRAVKLNGLEVVKILCQLVMRKNIALGSDLMRETESSATVLHVALLYNHVEIIQYLISLADKDLLMASYTTEEYRNQSTLHVAVANGNLSVVEMLLKSLQPKDRKLLINSVADGSYFIHQYRPGQLCLTAAAWSGNGEMLCLLAKYGANFKTRNLQGNTVLHSIVLSMQESQDILLHQEMIEKVYEAIGVWATHCKYKATIADHVELEQKEKQISTFQKLLKITNNCGCTPLALSAQMSSPLLLYFLNMEKIYKIPQTRLGSIAWVTYDVTEVASFSEDVYNKFSVLHVIAHNSGKLSRSATLEGHVDALDSEPIKSIVEMKWRVYRWIYIAWCLIHAVQIALFTYATFEDNSLTPSSDNLTQDRNVHFEEQEPKTHHYLVIFMIIPTIYILLELVDIFGTYPYSICFMRNQSLLSKLVNRIKSEWAITGNGPYRCVCFAYSVSSIIWYVLFIKRAQSQVIALAMTLLFGWIFILFFTRGCRVTSRFSIMIQKMFFRDLMYFLAVYVMILAAFSFSINAMYLHYHTVGSSYMNIIYSMMNTVTQLDSKQKDINHPTFPVLTKALLLFYSIVAVILLMNMLIAMMNTSYETVRITGSSIWKQQQLSIMLMLERRLCWIKTLCRYSEKDVWHKELDSGTRALLDVTTTQRAERKRQRKESWFD